VGPVDTRGWSRGRHGRWVHDVLLLHRGPGLVRCEALAVANVTYQGPALLGQPLSHGEITAISIGIIIVLTAINHVGAKLSGRTQLVLAGVPMLLLLDGSLYGLIDGGGARLGEELAQPHAFEMPALGAVAAAYLPVYWTYAGWNAVTYVAGEVREPRRGLPRALVLGTGAVTVLYMLLNCGFLGVLGADGVRNNFEVGSATAAALFGQGASKWMTALIFIAILSATNGTVLGGSRIVFAMAEGGMFPRAGARLDRRFKTPTLALWLQAAWTSLLILSAWLVHKDSVKTLLDYTTTAMLITGSLAVGAVLVLRQRAAIPADRYRTLLYPVTPFLYLASSIGVLVLLLKDGKPAAVGGVVILVAALAAGWFFTHRSRI